MPSEAADPGRDDGGAVLDRAAVLADHRLRGREFTRAYTAPVDDWLVARFTAAVAPLGHRPPAALVAVGGYGRSELCPGSDLDLLIVGRPGEDVTALAEAIWYPIWDEGLKLGHAVRTPKEALALAADDLDTATSLLAGRHLAGDPALTAEVVGGAQEAWRKRAKRWLPVLRDAVLARQERFGDVAFLLEPELKEGRGGLRDIHSLRWAEQARPVLQPGDRALLDEAEEVLLTARVELHRATGRPGDLLTLQDQDTVATAMGIDADALMAEVSAAARTVAWVGDEIWHRVGAAQAGSLSLLGWRSRNRAPGLVVRDGEVHLESSVDPASTPLAVLDVAVLAASKRARPARETLQRLVERAPDLPDPWPVAARDRLVELLRCGHDAIPVIEALDQTGLWLRLLPEWAPVRNRPQRNAYHRFTVDRHLLEAAANAAALADRVGRPDLLVVGALLHDLGKGHPGDHTEVGIDLVGAVATRLSFPPEDVAVLVDLVRHHLLLPDVATRRDLSDDATIDGVAAAVGDPERLALLAALTEADSLATGPAAWGRWKADLVRDLVRKTDQVLQGASAGVLVDHHDFPDAGHRALLAAGATVVRGSGDTLLLVAPDRSGLLSRAAGALALHGLDVLAADAHADAGMAVERFRVSSAYGSMIPWDRVEHDVARAVTGRLAVEARLAARARTYARRARPGLAPSEVVFDDAASHTATVVEVHAPDSIGLLYRVTRAIADLDLDLRTAKVQTLGDQVVDAFYVTHSDGALVTDPELRSELERAIRHAVTRLSTSTP
ncbi:MAG: glnD [Acidimicrobiales bacterium]|nr:glnD [Acidimicrobiales bacterium]